jgi:hypothetical protein
LTRINLKVAKSREGVPANREDAMAALKKLAHREWQDWVCVVLGVCTLVSPFMVDERVNGIVTLNGVVLGLVVTIISQFEIFGPTAWEEVVNATCGLWLIASPFVFRYAGAGQLRFWHFVLGALIAIIAVAELWQDRRKVGA